MILAFVCIWNVFRKINQNREHKAGKIRLGLILITLIYATFLGVLLFDLFYLLIKWTDIWLYNSVDYPTLGHLVAASGLGLICTLIVGGIQSGQFFLKKWVESQLEAEKNKKKVVEMQLHSLRQQLEPHFLFNSFSTLDNLIHSDQEKASDFLHLLAQFYQRTLETYDKTLIPVLQEIDMLKIYVKLLKLRFGENLGLSVDLRRGALNKTFLPPLTLQILVENAIKHNVVDENEFIIRIREEKNGVVVSNPRRPRKTMTRSNKLGLQNLKTRLELLGRKMEIQEGRQTFEVYLEWIK